MAKPNGKHQVTEAHQAWLDAEAAALNAEATAKEARDKADAAASALAAELKAKGKNAVDGPDGRDYVVQACRKGKRADGDGQVIEVEPPYPFTLRRAAELRK